MRRQALKQLRLVVGPADAKRGPYIHTAARQPRRAPQRFGVRRRLSLRNFSNGADQTST
jgi:hypothetical protein